MPVKINLKHLSYLSRADKCDKQGFLFKRGAFVNTEYKKRWFMLTGNLLFYFKNSTTSAPTGAIVVEDCRVAERNREQTEPFYYCFSIFYDGEDSREYQLAATTKQDYDSWVEAIKNASFHKRKQRLDKLQLKMFKEEFCRGTFEFGEADGPDEVGRTMSTRRQFGPGDVRTLASAAEPGTGFYDPSRPEDTASGERRPSGLDYGHDFDVSSDEDPPDMAEQLEALSLASASGIGSDDESEPEESDFIIDTNPDGTTSTRYVTKKGIEAVESLPTTPAHPDDSAAAAAPSTLEIEDPKSGETSTLVLAPVVATPAAAGARDDADQVPESI